MVEYFFHISPGFSFRSPEMALHSESVDQPDPVFLLIRFDLIDYRFENDLLFPVSLVVIIIEQLNPVPEHFPRQAKDLDIIMLP